jgi:hypothetical protein
MSNPNSAFGLPASRSLGRSNLQTNLYAHDSGDSVALFRNDPVITAALGGTTGAAGIPDGTPICTASGTVTTGSLRGAVASVSPTLTNLSLNYCPASTEMAIYVWDDPNQCFYIQSNGTVLVDDIGDTMGITSGTGSTVTGVSAYVATESTGHADASDCLRVIRLAPIVNNVLGAYSILEVKINVHELAQITTP